MTDSSQPPHADDDDIGNLYDMALDRVHDIEAIQTAILALIAALEDKLPAIRATVVANMDDRLNKIDHARRIIQESGTTTAADEEREDRRRNALTDLIAQIEIG